MKKLWSIWICCLLFFAGGVPLRAQTVAEKDELLQLLRQEVKQQFASLQQTDNPPYFLAYRINETTDFYISANFGHIYENNTSKNVFLTIEIRVGNPLTDNYHSSLQKSREIKQIPLPIEENLALIRKIIQKETQVAYTDAVLKYVDNQSNIRLFSQKQLQDFSFLAQKTVAYYEPRILENHWHEEVWLRALRYCTADAAMLPDMTKASANLHFTMSRQYMVNSENSYVVENQTSTNLSLYLEGITSENIPEHIGSQFYTKYPEQLPDADALLSEMLQMETKLNAKLDASKAQSVLCPVWLSPQAAAVLAHHLFGHELEENESSVFDGLLAQTVLPSDFSVVVDPTLPQRAGQYWNGSYVFDDEGVESERVTLIENGDLKNRLAARTQQPEAFHPNGHARGKGKLPAARQSNLLLSTSKPLNDNQLLDLFQREIKNQQLEFGILVQEVDWNCDTTHRIITVYPTVCYKIFADGRPNELVRDVKIASSARQWIDNLMVGGNQTASVALTCHSLGEDLPTHSSAPSLVFRRLEVMPHMPSPSPRMVAHLYTTSDQYDYIGDLFKRVAEDEREIDEVSLLLGEVNPPYYQEYLMTDARVFAVEAAEESVFYSREKSVRQLVPRVLLGGDLMNNENIYGNEANPSVFYPVSEDVNYPAFARDFRKATEAEYRKAIPQWDLKRAILQHSDKKALADRSHSEASQSFQEQSMSYPALSNLEQLARETSAELSRHDFLTQSGVNVYVMMGNVYFWNSEKTAYIRPVSIIALQIYGTVNSVEGVEYKDGKTLFFSSIDSLFTSQNVQKEIDRLLSHLYEVKRASQRQHFSYTGPVLVEGEAVGQLLASALLEEMPNLLAYREPLMPSSSGNKRSCMFLENSKDQIVTSGKITVTANKSGDKFDKAVFCRHEKTDAEGVETMETEIIRKGELITLMGNRTPTKSIDYSNGFQQLAIQNEACFTTRGATRLDFEFRTTTSHDKLKQMLVKEAKKQGCRYAYIIRQVFDYKGNMEESLTPGNMKLWQLYRVDVRTGTEIPIVGGTLPNFSFSMLENIMCVSDAQEAYSVFAQVRGALGGRDFPYAGVPTCIVAPKSLLFNNLFIGN
jgi:predicted Zn-dependent protease